MSKVKFYVSLILLLVISFESLAAKEDEKKIIGTVPGPYIGIDIGSGGRDFLADSQVPNMDSFKYFNIEQFYGGYLWNINNIPKLKLGMEVGYFYEQDYKFYINEQYWIYSGFNAYLSGIIRYNIVNSNFFLLGKIGATLAYQTVKMYGYGDPKSSTKNKILPLFGLGIGYDATQNIELHLLATHAHGHNPEAVQYSVTSLDNIDKVVSINALLVGITYHF